MRWHANILLLIGLIGTTGCSRYDVIPDQLEGRVKKDVSFSQIEQSPSSYKGQLVVVGGEVLSTKRLEDGTQIEVLQLPLTEDYIPITEDRTKSEGRFYAYDGGKEILDPAVLPKGTPVTLVGEVTGVTMGKIDEGEQPYPTLLIKDLTKWDKSDVRRWAYTPPYPYYGHYWYGARPFRFYYW
ncbi:MAG TPA: Slp family lipoprotein [Nitrospiraceae bacterium]|nr:Slp family lipoprotein [Nitrospiraceae bacterium]